MSIQSESQCRRGRPGLDKIEPLRTKVWFWEVALRLGYSGSGYALDKHFFSDKFHRDNGITRRPCKFDKYKRGEHTPNPELIETVERAFPGSKQYIEHPFWEVAKCPCQDLDSLYENLLKLRPDIRNLLFFPLRKDGLTPQRINMGYIKIFELLGREGDWDGLTACVGLIQEAKYFGRDEMVYIYTRPTFNVFRRFVSEYPFLMVSHEFYAYLMNHILNNPEGNELNDNITPSTLDRFTELTTSRILIIEDLALLKHHFLTPKSCLHVAEKYLTAQVINKIDSLILSGRTRDIYKLAEIKKLSLALKRWESKHN